MFVALKLDKNKIAYPSVLFIYIKRLATNEIFSPSNKIIMATLILLPALLYLIPTVTNNRETNVHNTIIEN